MGKHLNALYTGLLIFVIGMNVVQLAKDVYPSWAIRTGRQLELAGKRLQDDGFAKFKGDTTV